MRHRPLPPPPLLPGVSLVEALVALAVMSFGMLALIGVQSTMRINTDLSRQTTEATRIAAEDIESLRLFNDVRSLQGQATPAWDDLSGRDAAVLLPGDTGNVSFALTRQLQPFPDPPEQMSSLGLVAAQARIAQTTVSWTDRTGANRSVRLQGVVAAASPSLSGVLALPPLTGATARNANRHVSIPVSARDLGDGRSAFKPSASSTVVWVFNNVTGAITSRCPSVTAAQSQITASMVDGCPAIGNGSLLSGVVRFHLLAPPSGGYTAAQAENPQGDRAGESLALAGTPLSIASATRINLVSPVTECFASAAFVPDGSSSTRPSAITYNCLVYAADATGWGGRLDPAVAITGWAQTSNLAADSTAQRYRVCRYTRASSEFTLNRDHPKTYCMVASNTCSVSNRVTRNLTHQNFLVVSAEGLCPTDSDNNTASGQNSLVNANTLAHLPS